MPKRSRQGQTKCNPLGESAPAPSALSFENQEWINPDRGIIDEDVAVYFSHIDIPCSSGGDYRHRAISRDGYMKVLGEVI
jgi:hypothetical protein